MPFIIIYFCIITAQPKDISNSSLSLQTPTRSALLYTAILLRFLQQVCTLSLFPYFTWQKTVKSNNFDHYNKKYSWSILSQKSLVDDTCRVRPNCVSVSVWLCRHVYTRLFSSLCTDAVTECYVVTSKPLAVRCEV